MLTSAKNFSESKLKVFDKNLRGFQRGVNYLSTTFCC